MNWWNTVDTNWEQLSKLIYQFHPCYHVSHEYTITASMAEKACESIRRDITRQNACEAAEQAKLTRDADTLISILNETWFGMPESTDVRGVSGFFVLCDLCSSDPYED
jgi:hypothetical protein